MSNHEVYLDANATTPVLPAAAKAAYQTMDMTYGNPSSSHITGIRAKYIMENARSAARKLLGASDGKLIFTSGATEGIQTAVVSALWDAKQSGNIPANAKLLYGATEHKAVPETLKHWNRLFDINAEVVAIPVNDKGILDHSFIAQNASDALMICTMAVNNETGVYQDLELIENTIRAANPNAKWLCDCVQAMGKRKLELSQCTIDYAVFSGHKLYAPKGIGLLYIRESAPYTPFIAGGGQESGLRSGTENLPGIAAIGTIFDLLNDKEDDTFKPVETLNKYREQIAETLHQVFPEIIFNNDFSYSVPTTLNFSVPGLSSKEIMDLFDANQVRVSSGSACSSKVTGSFVLDAMGIPLWRSESAIRMSFGPATSQQEIDQACQAIKQASTALKGACLLTTNEDDPEKGELDGIVQLHHDGACSWIVADKAAQSCIIIDPVEALAERIEQMVRCRNYSVKAILDTHGHADHDSCAKMLKTVLADTINNGSTDNLGWPSSAESSLFVNDTELSTISFGRWQLARLNTPGHTDDSTSFLLKAQSESAVSYAFVGDTLLIGGIGRTDFSSSNAGSCFHSLQLLNKLTGDNTVICPAHDYNNQFTTSLQAERIANPLLDAVLSNNIDSTEFAKQKTAIDSAVDNQSQSAQVLMCGTIDTCAVDETGMHLSPNEAKQLLANNTAAVILDVRESYEHKLSQLEQSNPSKNVPLTRFTGNVAEILNDYDKSQEFVCICRSGSRSQVVAKTLRRLGFYNTKHVTGGMAMAQS